jgi:hypothetical protein
VLLFLSVKGRLVCIFQLFVILFVGLLNFGEALNVQFRLVARVVVEFALSVFQPLLEELITALFFLGVLS